MFRIQHILLIAEVALLQIESQAPVMRRRPAPRRLPRQQPIGAVEAAGGPLQHMPLPVQLEPASGRQAR